MNMLIEELQALAADPRSWIVVAGMALIAGISLFGLLACPYTHGKRNASPDEVEAARSSQFQPGARFGLMMVVGACLTIAGLFMIANGIKPTLALAAVVLGVLIIQTEPSRLRIRQNKQQVVASQNDGTIALDAARGRLRSSHLELAATNMVLLTALIAGLLAF